MSVTTPTVPELKENQGLVARTDEILRTKNLEIIYDGPFGDAGGYAKMNREVVRSLAKLGVRIQSKIFRAARKGLYEVDISDIENMERTDIHPNAPQIFGSVTQSIMPTHNKYNIAFTMMETQTIAHKFAQKCNWHNEVWVPVKWNMDTFKAGGVSKPMHQIPLGVDSKLYNPNVEPFRFNENIDGKFVFLSVFGWSLRKGYDVLLNSWYKAFKDNPNVSLVIMSKIWGSESADHQRTIQNELYNFQKAHGATITNVFHLGVGVPEDQLPRLYKAAHCFVLPTRGEGWGLPYCEAGACEVPVIATRYGGQLEFLDDDNSYLVDIEGYETCKRLKLNIISSSYGDDILIACLKEKATNDFADTMLDVYNNYDKAKEKAKRLRQHLVTNFTWEQSARKIVERLDKLI